MGCRTVWWVALDVIVLKLDHGLLCLSTYHALATKFLDLVFLTGR